MASIEDGIQAQLANIQTRSNAVIGTASALELQVLNLPEIDDENITSSLTSMSLSISASYSITGGTISLSSAGNATTIDGINVWSLASQVSQNTQDIGINAAAIAQNAQDIAALQQSLINLSDTVSGLANTG